VYWSARQQVNRRANSEFEWHRARVRRPGEAGATPILLGHKALEQGTVQAMQVGSASATVIGLGVQVQGGVTEWCEIHESGAA